MTPRLGLIGYPLSHSFSPGYFAEKFQREGLEGWSYQAFPLEDIHLLPALLDRYPSLIGLNVTIPYKQAVRQYVSQEDPVARAIGAINTLVIGAEGIRGFNTDAPAFQEVLRDAGAEAGMQALVLGSGGASLAVCYALRMEGIAYQVVSREPGAQAIPYTAVTPEKLAKVQLIINTTPLGMYPYTEGLPPLPYSALHEGHTLIDLIYNPLETAFLALGRKQGASTVHGLKMLYLQAEKSWDIWTRNR